LILDSLVVFATRSGWVVAMSRDSGLIRWKTRVLPAGTPILGRNMACDGDVLLVPAVRLVALDVHTGETRWTFEADGDAVGDESVALTDSLGFAGGAAGWLYAVKLRTGTESWRLDVRERPFGLVPNADLLYLGTRGISPEGLGAGHAMAVNLRTGVVQWRFPIPDAPGRPKTGGSTGFPAISPSSVFFTGISGRVYALDRQTGARQWEAGDWSTATNQYDTGPILAADVLIAARDDGEVLAWDPQTGTPRWSARIGSPVDQPVSDGHHVFFNTSRVYALAPDGRVSWVFPGAVSGFGFASPPAVASGMVYLVADDGFYALSVDP
jgi:outer membrane protein assembly factor BamB